MEVKLAILQKERFVCSTDVINLGVSESNMLEEVGDKALCARSKNTCSEA